MIYVMRVLFINKEIRNITYLPFMESVHNAKSSALITDMPSGGAFCRSRSSRLSLFVYMAAISTYIRIFNFQNRLISVYCQMSNFYRGVIPADLCRWAIPFLHIPMTVDRKKQIFPSQPHPISKVLRLPVMYQHTAIIEIPCDISMPDYIILGLRLLVARISALCKRCKTMSHRRM